MDEVEFRKLLERDRRGAIVWLCNQVWNDAPTEAYFEAWVKLNTGEMPFVPLCDFDDEHLVDEARSQGVLTPGGEDAPRS